MEQEADIPFHKISLEDRDWYRQIEKSVRLTVCDLPFAGNYVWGDSYQTEVARIEGCLVNKFWYGNRVWFTYPISGSKTKRLLAVKRLTKYCAQNGLQLCFTLITDEQREELNGEFRGRFEIDAVRDGFDYVYERERLATLKGKKLEGKRNHIHRFVENCQWQYEELCASNLEECWKLEEHWLNAQGGPQEDLLEEKRAIRKAIDNFELLGLFGGLIRRDGQVVAFCIGEQLNDDTIVVHFEKARDDIHGSYQIINQQFAERYSDFMYINREDDTGDQGLRKSKLSYHPDFMVRKYFAVESGYSYALQEDRENIISIWEECFGDEREYIEFYLKYRFREDNMLCVRENGRIVSMASFFPGVLKKGEREWKVLYIYAVATLPPYRKRGYAAGLLRHIAEKYGVILILCPASGAVEAYYEKLGFQHFFADREREVSVGAVENASFQIYDRADGLLIENYQRKRRERFDGGIYVDWDEEYIGYALEECLFSGGHIAEFASGFVLFYVSGKDLQIVESTLDENELGGCIGSLVKNYGADSAHFIGRGGMLLSEGRDELNGEEEGYLGLTLD